MNIHATGGKLFVHIVIKGVLGDALKEALVLWGYEREGIRLSEPIDAQKVPEELSATGSDAAVVAGIFTKEEEDMTRDLLVSVRLLRNDCTKVPFVFLALDAHVPPIFLTAGCHIRVLPRDTASLEHIHALRGPSDKECEEFITTFGKPALLHKVLKKGRDLFHNPAKRSLSIKSAHDMNMLNNEVRHFCDKFMASLDCMERDASLIGLCLADMWSEIGELRGTVMRLEGLASAPMEMDFQERMKAIRAEREKIIETCMALQNQFQDKGALSWTTR